MHKREITYITAALLVVVAALLAVNIGSATQDSQSEVYTVEPRQPIVIAHNDEPAQLSGYCEILLDEISPQQMTVKYGEPATLYNRVHAWQTQRNERDDEDDEKESVAESEIFIDIPSINQQILLRSGEHIDLYLPKGTHEYFVSEAKIRGKIMRGQQSGTIIVE